MEYCADFAFVNSEDFVDCDNFSFVDTVKKNALSAKKVDLFGGNDEEEDEGDLFGNSPVKQTKKEERQSQKKV